MRGDKFGGSIRWRMHLPVPPEQLYEALDSDAGRAAFWAESAIEQAGFVEFRFVSGETCSARILDRRPPHVWSIDYFGATARFEVAPDGHGGMDLLLTHSGVRAGEWHEVHAGWLNVLFPLKAWVVHGVDLRNHDAVRTWEQGYADQ